MSQSVSNEFVSPELAEAAFYEAISRGDLKTLMSIWSMEEDVVCVHPTGQRFLGLEQIREG
ncbi:MAG: hypothetical protein RIR18_1622, partial [Pseudomonadota bacterium]